MRFSSANLHFNDTSECRTRIQREGVASDPRPYVTIDLGVLSIFTRSGLDNAILDIDKLQTALREVREKLDAMKLAEVKEES